MALLRGDASLPPPANDEDRLLASLCAPGTHTTQQIKILDTLIVDYQKLQDPALATWIQDLNDASHLVSNLQVLRTADMSRWTITNSHDPVDLIVLGDETGGCQALSNSSDLNKHLLGYQGDGKVRLIAVHNEEGRLVARSILRLLEAHHPDGTTQPALLLEPTYSHQGEALTPAIRAFALREANRLGFPLYRSTIFDTPEGVPLSPSPTTLHSERTNMPFEYVDSIRSSFESSPYTCRYVTQVVDPV